jgi:apolipoprotein N-acyltransferase
MLCGMGKQSWRTGMMIQLAAAVASGLLVAGLFPPFRFSAMVWVALVPMLVALWSLGGKRAGWKGFGLGWLAGSVSCAIQFSWLSVVSPLGAALMPLYLGLYWGAFGAFAATWGNPGNSPAGESTIGVISKSLRTGFCHAAVWAGLEWLRGWLLTGFGWNGLGVAFHETPAMAQSADLLGVTGLSMVPVFFQTVLVQAGRRMMEGARDGQRRTRLDFATAAAVVGVLVCYGIVRIATEGRGETTRLKALLVQLNIPQEAARQLWDGVKVHMAYEDETLKGLEALAEKDQERLKEAMGKSEEGTLSLSWPDWVMWPETALTGRIFRLDDGSWGTHPENQRTIAEVRQAGPFQLIYGVNELEAQPTPDGQLEMKPQGRAWNSIAVMNPEDQLQTYRKRHLVIFGETIPFVDSIPFLRKIYEQQAGVEYGGSFSPGESLDPLPIPTADGKVIGAIPTVCFEDSVPRLTRKFVRPGPQVIINVTNDGWFKESAAAAQHFANARFRAIELRRPMLRCANTGVSAAVDSTGTTAHPDSGKPQVLVDEKGSHFTRGSLLVELKVPENPSSSLYALIGDWGVIALSVVGLGIGFRTRRRVENP